MGIIKTATEGGQLWTHRLRMAKQIFGVASTISLVFAAFILASKLYQIPKIEYEAGLYYLKAHLQPHNEIIPIPDRVFGYITQQSFNHERTVSVGVGKFIRNAETSARLTGKKIENSLSLALRWTPKIFILSMIGFLIKGWRSQRKKHIDGKRLVSVRWLTFKLRLMRKASPIQIGPLPLVKGTETQHILISGTTGSGKSTAYHSILPTIRDQKQRAIIVDTSEEYAKKYYRKEIDFLLNPFNPNSQSWHPWCECKDDIDIETIVENFIPHSHHPEERFWVQTAQEVLRTTLKKMKDTPSTRELEKILRCSELNQLSEFFAGTTAGSLINQTNDKTASSILANVSSFLKCLTHLPDTTTPFSIRKWVEEEKEDSWLFLTCSDRELAALGPLLTVWVSVAITSLIQLQPSHDRRLWLVADELPRLNRLSNLEKFLSLSRKYGGCGLLAVQTLAQLETIYGRNVTKTILGNCSTRIVFAEYDAQEADMISRSFGMAEVKETHESLSYGSHEMRDGVSLSYQNKVNPIVSASAIQSLDKLEAFVKLPGNLSITKIKISHTKEGTFSWSHFQEKTRPLHK